MRFRTTVLQGGKTATGIRVPDEVVEALGSGKRPAVRVTINGFTYRSTVAVMDGAYMVGVSAENRAGARVAGGDEVDVAIELDTAPREVTLPADFAAALDAEPGARRTFDALSYSKSPGTCCRSRAPKRTRPASAASSGQSRACARAVLAEAGCPAPPPLSSPSRGRAGAARPSVRSRCLAHHRAG